MGNYFYNIIPASALTLTLRTGTVNLPLDEGRILATSDYQNTAATGGLLTSNTIPAILRLSTSSNIAARITWAASNSQELQWVTYAPADLDIRFPVFLSSILSISGVTDGTTVLPTFHFFEGIAGSDIGGAVVGPLTSAPTLKILGIISAALPVTPWSISIVPGTHTTDTLRLDALYITYTRK